jgi:hypothetical protein
MLKCFSKDTNYTRALKVKKPVSISKSPCWVMIPELGIDTFVCRQKWLNLDHNQFV